MPSDRHILVAIALSLSSAGVVAVIAPAAAIAVPAAKVQTVQIKNFAFIPAVLTISPGTTVTWTNTDEDPHSVVANDKSFRSTALDTDDKYSFTFTKPGDYSYFCSLHPHMTAHIVVKAS